MDVNPYESPKHCEERTKRHSSRTNKTDLASLFAICSGTLGITLVVYGFLFGLQSFSPMLIQGIGLGIILLLLAVHFGADLLNGNNKQDQN